MMSLCSAALAESPGGDSLNDQRLYQAAEEFIQQMIQHFLVKTCGEVMQDVLNRQKINLFPEIAMQATYQAANQLFKQDDMKDLLRDIFDENKSQAKDEINFGMPQAYIELGIKKCVERDINLIVTDPIFKYVIETMLNQAMVQQQKIVMMAAVQQQAQLMAIRQQQMIYQQMIMQQIIQNQFQNQLR